MNKAIISVENLTRSYGDYTAVEDASFYVLPGEVYGLLGTNGAGKTSTLEVVEGLAPATSGSVSIFGMDPRKDRAKVRRHLGIMLQSGGLPEQLTVKETMEMWAGTCSAPRPIEEVLDEVDLTHRLDVKVGALSGGEQRRLDLACALLGDPAVLFLDEPTTGLDPESRRRVWGLLNRLKEQGVTMMLTTHYLEEAELLCDRLAIMHKGRIQVEGTVSELTALEPAHLTYDDPDNPGTTITRTSTDLQHDTWELLEWAQANNHQLRGFAAKPATLEQVFLKVSEQEIFSQEPM